MIETDLDVRLGKLKAECIAEADLRSRNHRTEFWQIVFLAIALITLVFGFGGYFSVDNIISREVAAQIREYSMTEEFRNRVNTFFPQPYVRTVQGQPSSTTDSFNWQQIPGMKLDINIEEGGFDHIVIIGSVQIYNPQSGTNGHIRLVTSHEAGAPRELVTHSYISSGSSWLSAETPLVWAGPFPPGANSISVEWKDRADQTFPETDGELTLRSGILSIVRFPSSYTSGEN